MVGLLSQKYSKTLAGYFLNTPLYLDEPQKKVPNIRKLVEQPWQQIRAQLIDDLESSLCNLQFIEAKCSARLTFDLVSDFLNSSYKTDGRKETNTKSISDFFAFVKSEAHILAIHPHLTFQQAANSSEESAPCMVAKSLWETGKEHRPWLRLTNKFKTSGLITTMLGHIDSVKDASYSPGGSHIVSISGDGMMKIWDSTTGFEKMNIQAATEESTDIHCFYSSDGTRITTFYGLFKSNSASDWFNIVREWDAKSGFMLNEMIKPFNDLLSCLYVNNILVIVSGANYPLIQLINFSNNQVLITIEDNINICVLSPDGKRLLGGNYYGGLKVWDMEEGTLIVELDGHQRAITSCSFSPDGRRIVTACEVHQEKPNEDTSVKVWDADSGDLIYVLQGHNAEVRSCSFSNDQKWIISGSRDGSVIVWDNAKGEMLTKFPDHGGGVNKCQFSPDSLYILSACTDGALRIWDTQNLKQDVISDRHSGTVNALKYSPCESKVLTGSGDRTMKIWNSQTCELITTLTGHNASVNDCSFSPGGGKITSVAGVFGQAYEGQNCSKLWDANSGSLLATMNGHTLLVSHCCYSPDGSLTLTAGFDKEIFLWDVRKKYLSQRLKSDEMTYDSVFACDGSSLVSGHAKGRSFLWDLTGHVGHVELAGHKKDVWSVNFSPDCRIFATSSEYLVRIWERFPRQKRVENCYCFEDYTSCCFSPSGRFAILRHKNDQLWLWISGKSEPTILIEEPAGTIQGFRFWNYTNTPIITGDGRYIVWSNQGILRIWNILDKRTIMSFIKPGHRSCGFSNDMKILVLADFSGSMYFLEPLGIEKGPSLVTATYLYRNAQQRFDSYPSVRCPSCGKRFRPLSHIIDSLVLIDRTIFGHPEFTEELWENPNLFSTCPTCFHPLHFNPYLVDNRH